MRNRPSYTALKVARGVIWMGGDPVHGALLPEGAAACTREPLSAAGLHQPWHDRLFELRWFRRLGVWSANRMMPGQLELVALRKRLVEDEVRDAIAGGATQVLVVGAGFDTLTRRLAPQHAAVTFVELDHPATQRVKRAAVERIDRPVPANLHFVPADLSQVKLGEVLRASDAWSPDAKSIVVAEGVLMYLEEVDVAVLFDELRRCVGDGTRVVFSHLRADSRGRAELGRWAWLTRAGLRAVGESMRWGLADPEPFLAAHGLTRVPPPERSDPITCYRERLGERVVASGIEDYAVVTFAQR